MTFETKTSPVGATRLMLEAKDGDLRSCLVLVDDFGEIAEQKTVFGVSLLHFAALNREHGLEIIRYFFKYRSLGLCKDVDGEEPIHFAVRADNFDNAQLLLTLRKSPIPNLLHFFIIQGSIELLDKVHRFDRTLLRSVDAQGRNALLLAAEFADVSTCEWLLHRGVDPKTLSAENNSIFHHAVLNSCFATRLIRYLAAWELDANGINERGETPLELALRLNRHDAALELLNSGSCSLRKNLLHLCVARNDIKSVQFVYLADQAQTQMVDSRGRNAIHVAAELADAKMCQVLLEAGVDVAALSGDTQASALHFVGLNKAHGGEDMVRFFTSLGHSLFKRDGNGLTPLHYALKASNLHVAAVMVRRGASLKPKVDGLNLLYFCVKSKSLCSAKFIYSLDKEQLRDISPRELLLLLSTQTGTINELSQWIVGTINNAAAASSR